MTFDHSTDQDQSMYISTENIPPTVTERSKIDIAHKQKVAYGLSIGIHIFDIKVKFKIMHIVNVNISQTVKVRADITIVIIYEDT